MINMLLGIGVALYFVALYFALRCLRTIWRVVDESRADAPSRYFAMSGGGVRGGIIGRGFRRAACEGAVREYALFLLFGAGFVLIVLHYAFGGWPR
jgi:hypothetical protein